MGRGKTIKRGRWVVLRKVSVNLEGWGLNIWKMGNSSTRRTKGTTAARILRRDLKGSRDRTTTMKEKNQKKRKSTLINTSSPITTKLIKNWRIILKRMTMSMIMMTYQVNSLLL